jgi:hypothetical protein
MSHDWQRHVIHAAAHDKDSKLGAIVLIVMGFFFTPMLIGIPIMLFGFYRLCK